MYILICTCVVMLIYKFFVCVTRSYRTILPICGLYSVLDGAGGRKAVTTVTAGRAGGAARRATGALRHRFSGGARCYANITRDCC